MRFVVYGAGAVGGVIGAKLALAGHEVVLIARGAHLEAIRAGGLRLEEPTGSRTLAVEAAGTPGEVRFRPDDVVLLATKSQDTAGALGTLVTALESPGVEGVVTTASLPVVCAQNGVHNEMVALRRFARVYAMCVLAPTAHMRPGVVESYSTPVTGILDVGSFPQGVDELAEDLAAAMRGASFESVARPDVMRWKYRKLLTNLANALDAVCGETPWPEGMAEEALAEGDAVLAAAGIDVASPAEDRERRGELLNLRPVAGARRRGGSTWQSLARGTGAVETDFLNGEIVLLGRLHGVGTPCNERLRSAAAICARNGFAPGSPEALAVLSSR